MVGDHPRRPCPVSSARRAARPGAGACRLRWRRRRSGPAPRSAPAARRAPARPRRPGVAIAPPIEWPSRLARVPAQRVERIEHVVDPVDEHVVVAGQAMRAAAVAGQVERDQVEVGEDRAAAAGSWRRCRASRAAPAACGPPGVPRARRAACRARCRRRISLLNARSMRPARGVPARQRRQRGDMAGRWR